MRLIKRTIFGHYTRIKIWERGYAAPEFVSVLGFCHGPFSFNVRLERGRPFLVYRDRVVWPKWRRIRADEKRGAEVAANGGPIGCVKAT